MLFLGIDPGQTGALAVINQSREILMLEDWPGDEHQAALLVSTATVIDISESLTAALEKVSAMPKQGVSSMFKFGTNFGIWKGILAAFMIPFEEVRPQAWQKGVISKAQDKKPALAAAGRMFPKAELTGPRGGGKDGRADALLIADYARRQFAVEPTVDRPRR